MQVTLVKLFGWKLFIGITAPKEPYKEAREGYLDQFSREDVIRLLVNNKGNISYAAKEGDIDRRSFRELMKKYGVTQKNYAA